MRQQKRSANKLRRAALAGFVWLLVIWVAACAPRERDASSNGSPGEEASVAPDLELPEFGAKPPGSGRLNVLATTGIIGDVVTNIAGDDADVTILMAANQDPHGYQTTAGDLRQVASADVVFVNGWGLEEGLLEDLENAAGKAPFVPLSAGIQGRVVDAFAGAEDHDEDSLHGVDPHVWLAPANVAQWVDNIEVSLTALDPDNADAYRLRAETYKEQLNDLDTYYRDRLRALEPGQRVLVTNHDAFGYFADEYGFEVVGTVIPGDSTLAEPASRDLALLLQSMRAASICSIFVERSASQQLASQLLGDLDHCDDVQIVILYSGALGDPGSGAESYLDMMRFNIDAIVDALQSSELMLAE